MLFQCCVSAGLYTLSVRPKECKRRVYKYYHWKQRTHKRTSTEVSESRFYLNSPYDSNVVYRATYAPTPLPFHWLWGRYEIGLDEPKKQSRNATSPRAKKTQRFPLNVCKIVINQATIQSERITLLQFIISTFPSGHNTLIH